MASLTALTSKMDITVLASGSRGNCYYVTDGVTPLLLEAGIRIKDIQQGLNFGLSQVAGCLVTHEHMDHCKAASDVVKAGVDTYLSKGTADALELTGHRIRVIKAMEQFKLGTWTILPFTTVHDAADPLGFLLASTNGEKLLFATDTAYIKYRFKGLNYIMVECNYSMDILRENIASGLVAPEMKKRLINSHFGLDNVKEFLKANDMSQVREIHLIHLSDNNSSAERFKREIQELTGKEVHIG